MADKSAKSIPFCAVATLLDKLELDGASKSLTRNQLRESRRRVIKIWWEKLLHAFGFDHLSLAVHDIFRLLFPCQDISRRYHLREPSLAEHLLAVFGLGGTSRGARLTRWKDCDAYLGVERVGQGDFAKCVEGTVRLQEPEAGGKAMTVWEVNVLLDELATYARYSTTEGGVRPKRGSRTARKVLEDLFRGQRSRECKWLIRIILKDLSIVHTWRGILNSFHPFLYTLHARQTDLALTSSRFICLLRDRVSGCPSDGHYLPAMLQYGKPRLHTCLTVMQCQQARSPAHALLTMQKEGETKCFAEIKYDGERMQIHVEFGMDVHDNGRITIFSKSGRNNPHSIIRAALGRPANIGPVPQCEPFEGQITCRTCILEGELLVFDEDTQSIEAFGTIKDVGLDFQNRRLSAPDDGVLSGRRHFQIVFFDILYLDDEDWTFRPYAQRRDALRRLIRPIPNWARLSKTRELDVPEGALSAKHTEALRALFVETIGKREEGLVIKGANSTYSAGRKSSWLKLKEDYIEGHGDTADFAVVGGAFCPRNDYLKLSLTEHPHIMNMFFVGCLTNNQQVNVRGDEGHFRVVFAFEAGFSRETLIALCRSLAPHRVPLSTSSPSKSKASVPYTYTCPKALRGKIEFIFPHPFAVELKGGGFVREPLGGPWVLRHPRLVKICGNDRGWQDTISFDELQELGQGYLRPLEDGGMKRFADLKGVDEKHLEKKRIPTRSPPGFLRTASMPVDCGKNRLNFRKMDVKAARTAFKRSRTTCIDLTHDENVVDLTKDGDD
ncbi:uncharacterized protein EV422DRAFT_592730 [Fimicolochytrium jonesii]|uniref:uncharacterized protein n=1 Tax=Fimicolochytrium jonesii TaxID=1396493 RepID=UPI0022FF0D1D|nr:uncharacterized protein EV422DRAFT_592730 [Fimicolochytrium jonesii]KAI8826606.1 hypothetical protein EV422DRAFT_592730 [Fimicolochytrium jonesii]